MINSTHATARRIAHNIKRFVTNGRTRKHVITKFTDKNGLMYFGTVDQLSDEHKVIRGFTISASHQDDHYSIGNINGYDVTLVDRSDILWNSDGSMAVHNWTIMTFDLHTKQDLPHIFINARNHDNKSYKMFFSTFPNLKEVNLGTFEDYSPEFTSRFALYSRPDMAIQTERLLPAISTKVMSAHLWPLSAECDEHVLYMYSDEKDITLHLLETMLENGLWLAAHLDHQVELV